MYFNYKADLRRFLADSGLSRLLPFHVPRQEHRRCSPLSFREFTPGFAVASYSVLKFLQQVDLLPALGSVSFLFTLSSVSQSVYLLLSL